MPVPLPGFLSATRQTILDHRGDLHRARVAALPLGGYAPRALSSAALSDAAEPYYIYKKGIARKPAESLEQRINF